MVEGTVKVTGWLLPTATVNGEAGELVTLLGKPESVMVGEPVKPFWPVIDTVTVAVDVPALAVSAVGDKAMLKSGEGVTVNAKVAECARDPDIPLNTTP